MQIGQDIKIKPIVDGAAKPEYGSKEAHCADLYCAENATIYPGEVVPVSVGFKTEIPEGWGAIIKDRSSMARKHRIHILGGVIDSDYRGEWKVLCYMLPGLSWWNCFRKSKYIARKGLWNMSIWNYLKSWIQTFKLTRCYHKYTNSPMSLCQGMRIAQVKFEKTYTANFVDTDTFTETERGEGGFGSTGM